MNKKYSYLIVGIIVGVALLGGTVRAMSPVASQMMDNILNKAGEMVGLEIIKEMRNENAGNEINDEDKIFRGSGGVFQEKWFKAGNKVTYIESGKFIDASTTLVHILNPFGTVSTTAEAAGLGEYARNFEGTTATSVVAAINLDITGAATSTGVVICGAAADYWSAPTYQLFNLTLPTSTKGVYENNQATTSAGFQVTGTGSTAKILLTHEYSYLNCFVTSTAAQTHAWKDGAGYIKAWTESTETFDGTYSVEINKNLQ